MALIKCSECGKEISDKSKACVNCGAPIKQKCPECGKEISDMNSFCSNCGYEFKKNVNEYSNSQQPKEKNLGLAVGGIIFSLVGILLINPLGLCSIFAIVLGSIAVATNPKEQKENLKFMLEYKNKARGLGNSSISLGVLGFILFIFNISFFVI